MISVTDVFIQALRVHANAVSVLSRTFFQSSYEQAPEKQGLKMIWLL